MGIEKQEKLCYNQFKKSVELRMRIHRFGVSVDCTPPWKSRIGQGETFLDRGFIILPDGYSDSNDGTRLVINCHGAGGTVTTDDSQTEHQVLTQYLVANGYAVMDVNGLPMEYAEKEGVDIRNNVGSPIAVRCYTEAYKYCVENFNIKPDVFVHGSSMGGISSANIVLTSDVPVIAHTAFCPVLDTYNEIFLHPWTGGLPKIALGKMLGFDKDTLGEYIYSEEKVGQYNPASRIGRTPYPVPLKMWHCIDDPIVSCEVTKELFNIMEGRGDDAALVTLPCGGHQPQLVGPGVEAPTGNVMYGATRLEIMPAVEDAFSFIRSHDK